MCIYIHIDIWESDEKNKLKNKEEENSVRERERERGYDIWKFVDGLGGVEKKDLKKKKKEKMRR